VPSAVFISVTDLPFASVTVAAPLSYEPPAIPILAAVRVTETSVNTGEPAGNDFETETVLATPFTEMSAFVGFAGTNFADTVRPTDGVSPEGLAAPVFTVGAGLDVVAHELPFDDVASVPQAVAICCLNGSLLLNRLNEISWPALGGSGAVGSETPSGVVDAAGADDPPALFDAVAEPSSDGGASGWVPEAVALDEALELELELELWSWELIIFIVRGTWIASTPIRRTPPTAAITFCRLAFALGSNFFFAIRGSSLGWSWSQPSS
jgi:hypothetical protein